MKLARRTGKKANRDVGMRDGGGGRLFQGHQGIAKSEHPNNVAMGAQPGPVRLNPQEFVCPRRTCPKKCGFAKQGRPGFVSINARQAERVHRSSRLQVGRTGKMIFSWIPVTIRHPQSRESRLRRGTLAGYRFCPPAYINHQTQDQAGQRGIEIREMRRNGLNSVCDFTAARVTFFFGGREGGTGLNLPHSSPSCGA